MPKEALPASSNSADKEAEETEEPSEEELEEPLEEGTEGTEGEAELQEAEQPVAEAPANKRATWKGASSELFNELKNPLNWIKYLFGVIFIILLGISKIIKWFFKLLLKNKIALILFLVLVLLAMLWIIFGK